MSRLAQLQALAKSIPPSPLREQGTPQLSDAIESILSRHFPAGSSTVPASSSGSSLPPRPGVTASKRPSRSEEMKKISDARNQDAIEGMIRSIQRIQANTNAEMYPLSDKILRPPRDPNTYIRIYNGLHLSLEGKARAWWKRFFQVRGTS